MHDGKPATSSLENTLTRLLERRRAQSTLRTLTKSPPGAVDFSSNDFLSLSTDPALRTAFLEELRRQPASFRLGSGGSRLLDGNSAYAEDLERDIAAFHNAPAGLLCNSGFDANAGLFTCIPQPGDVIIYDEMIHASVHDGMRASRAAKCLSFAHNSAADLRALLEDCIAGDQLIERGQRNVFVAVETVYSMDGDIAPLEEIVSVVERLLPQRNGHVIVDEAHSTGVFGPKGRGLVYELGLEERVFARLHTFGKALACSGAIILCSPLVRSYLINYARPLIYTTFMPFPSLAAVRAVYSLLQKGGTEPLARHLQQLVEELYGRLKELDARYSTYQGFDRLLKVPSERPRSPIFSLVSHHPRSLAKYCQEHGFVVRAVVPPTVPIGTQRVRVCLHAGNSLDEVQRFIDRIGEWVEATLAKMSQEDAGLVEHNYHLHKL